MKFTIIMTFLVMSSCVHSSHYVRQPHNPQTGPAQYKSNVMSWNGDGVLVTKEWMKGYEKRERGNKIPADDWIIREGNEYRIPSEVVRHSNDMP